MSISPTLFSYNGRQLILQTYTFRLTYVISLSPVFVGPIYSIVRHEQMQQFHKKWNIVNARTVKAKADVFERWGLYERSTLIDRSATM